VFAEGRQLRRGRLDFHAAPPAVIADAGVVYIVGHGLLVNIAHVRADMRHASVVVKISTVPVPTVIAAARIAKTIVNPPVIANMRRPITGVESIMALIVIPVRRRP
jgi:hypothetical protein